MKKITRVVLFEEADSAFRIINKIVETQEAEGKKNTKESQLLKSIKQKIEFIRTNPFYGNNIPKSLIPKEYAARYNAKNLWRVELVGFWRMLYTIKGDQIEIICFVIDIVDHKEYNQKFAYKKR